MKFTRPLLVLVSAATVSAEGHGNVTSTNMTEMGNSTMMDMNMTESNMTESNMTDMMNMTSTNMTDMNMTNVTGNDTVVAEADDDDVDTSAAFAAGAITIGFAAILAQLII